MNSIHQRPIFVPHSGTKSASFFTSSSSSTSQGPQKRKAYDETPDIRVEAEERVIHRAGPQSGAHEQDNTIKKHQMSKIESQIHYDTIAMMMDAQRELQRKESEENRCAMDIDEDTETQQENDQIADHNRYYSIVDMLKNRSRSGYKIENHAH